MSPAISRDPRFLLGRKLITSGSPEQAIDIFADLLENCRETLQDSFDSILCQYEYGNALFRASVQKQYAVIDETGEKANEDTGEADTKPAAKSQREIMAAAAEKRFVTDGSPEPKRAKIEVDSHKAAKTNDDTQEVNENGSNEEDDVVLALEMIETSLHGLLAKVAATSESQDELTISNELKDWALNQLPRFMVCLGDVYAFREEHGKAVDAYIRALSYREDKWKEMKGKNEPCSIEHLQSHRLYIEACTLVAEALLACPDGEDVVCDGDDKRVTYAKAGERIDYANSWYAMAREELEDHLCDMAKMSAAKVDIGTEKKDVCILVELVSGVGFAFENLKKGGN